MKVIKDLYNYLQDIVLIELIKFYYYQIHNITMPTIQEGRKH